MENNIKKILIIKKFFIFMEKYLENIFSILNIIAKILTFVCLIKFIN